MRSSVSYLLLVSMLALAAGCSEASDIEEGGESQKLQVKLTSVTPNHGSAGSTVMVKGENFSDNMFICFGNTNNCSSAAVRNSIEAEVVVPVGKGTVDVIAKLNDDSSTLASAFTYDTTQTGGGDDNYTMGDIPRILSMSPLSGLVNSVITIQGERLDKVSKICFSTNCIQPSSVTATQVVAKAPEGSGTVKVMLISENTSLTAGYFSYITPNTKDNEIDWCKLTSVPQNVQPGNPVEVRAQVYEQDCTPNSAIKCSNLIGEAGYILSSSPKAADVISYSWNLAENTSDGKGTNDTADEFKASLKGLPEGEYNIAFRFSLDGKNWKYCDLNDSNDGFSLANVGKTTISKKATETTVCVSECVIINNASSYTMYAGETSTDIRAKGKVGACTDSSITNASIKAEVGYGPAYLSTPDNYVWRSAKQISAADNGYDVFSGNVEIHETGAYSVLYRMSLDNGKTWTYCDTTADAEASVQDAFPINVVEKNSSGNESTGSNTEEPGVDWCIIQAPESPLTVRAGSETENIYGQVYVHDCTGGISGCSKLKAQLGYGDPSKDVSSFTFVDATRNTQAYEAGNNDEYMAVLNPQTSGNYAYAYRFSTDGKNWSYCDYKGNDFKMANAGKLTVTENIDKIGWCRIMPEHWVNTEPNEQAAFYGQVFVEGCTEVEGSACSSIKAQLGYGSSTDELSKFTYVDAQYNAQANAGNNDEFMATMSPKTSGLYEIVYRFSTNNGQTWTYCDTQDHLTFDRDAAAVANASTLIPGTDYACGMTPNSVNVKTNSGKEVDVYSQIWIPNCTNNNAHCDAIVGAHVHYTKGEGYDVSTWTTKDAQVNAGFIPSGDMVNNIEYMSKFTINEKGAYRYVFSYDVKLSGMDKAERVYCFPSWETSPSSVGFGQITIE